MRRARRVGPTRARRGPGWPRSLTVRAAKLSEVADEFDKIHTVQRALAVGSVDRIIPAETLRPYIVDALDRGMSQE